jgi:thiol-disulfide isomerase/thioredoxin
MKKLLLMLGMGLLSSAAHAVECDYTVKIYTATWCGPCRVEKQMLHQGGLETLAKLEAHGAEYSFCIEILDIDQNPDSSIRAVPTHRIFDNETGRLLSEKRGGYRTRGDFLAYLISVIPE